MLEKLNNLEQKELFETLRTKKAELIAEKKGKVKFTDTLVHSVVPVESQKKSSTKGLDSSSEDSGSLDVTVVCNTAWFCDSDMDVITDKAYDKSIAARGTSIPHIADHIHESTSHVGDVKAVYTKKVRCKDLGLDIEGETTALLMDSTIRKDYNEQVYTFYKAGKINQHSIGLTYGELDLALNSQVEEDAAAYALWQKYYPQILNKELVDKRGYFWIVPEIDVRENSCVLFGANALTPTLSTEQKSEVLSAKNKGSNFVNVKQGVNMTVEELQAEVIRLSAENSQLKGSQETAVKAAVKAEQERILGIQKSAETFGIKSDISKFIKMNADVDACTAMFEAIKEASQISNPSPEGDIAGAADKSNTKSQEEVTDGMVATLKGFEELAKAQSIFAGVK